MNALQFRLWALMQDNLTRAEKIDRTQSDEHRALLQRQYNETENEIAALRAKIQNGRNV